MPCSDGMSKDYNAQHVQQIQKRAEERGYAKAVGEFKPQLEKISEQTKNVTTEYRQLETAICALLRYLAIDASSVEDVIEHSNIPEESKNALFRFWKAHEQQDRQRVKNYMSSWDLADKQVALALLQKELFNDDNS